MLSLIKSPNFIMARDSYKAGHWQEIPSDIKYAVSAIVPRKPSKRLNINEVVAAGLAVCAEILVNTRITHAMIDEAEIEANEQGYEFNRAGWERIVTECDGKLPIAMYGVEEGRVVHPQTPIAMFTNTKPGFAWLASDIETWSQGIIWKMSSVASVCRAARLKIRAGMIKSGADLAWLDYKLHNFGDRATTPEDAIMAGIAHAMLFNGSDCLRANGYIKTIYHTNEAYLSSVEATEHSTMCMNSNAAEKDDFGAAEMAVTRLEAVVKRVKQKYIGIPLMSAVIDTYDSRRFVREYLGTRLKDRILASGGKFVARPDSGDVAVEPGLVAKDWEDTVGLAGYTSTGYKILNPAVGVLQGDGIRLNTIDAVQEGFMSAGYSWDNFVLGMGHGTTNDVSRDDFSFSMKAMAFSRDGKSWTRLLKEPKTDLSKKSLSGLIRCAETVDGDLDVIDMTNDPAGYFTSTPGWRLYSKDGERHYLQSFDDVMARARSL
jgi:nicotinamide phosphoribosyltransferase